MKTKEYTVLHVTRDVQALDRAGQKAGQTSVARLGGITPQRARRMLNSAVKLGLLATYRDAYRPLIKRTLYMITNKGDLVVGVLDENNLHKLWSLNNE